MNKDQFAHSTHTDNVAESMATLTTKHLREAIKKIKEMSNMPYCTHMTSQEDLSTIIEKSYTARNWCLYGGIPVHQSMDVPTGIVRIHMSDGTHTDIPFKSTPDYLPFKPSLHKK